MKKDKLVQMYVSISLENIRQLEDMGVDNLSKWVREEISKKHVYWSERSKS